MAFEAEKSDQDLSLPLANVLVKYSLSELVHKLLEGNTTQEALLIDPEMNEIHLKQLFYVENVEKQTEAFLKYLYRTNNVERLREYANTCESAVGYLARLGHVYLEEF